MPLAVPLVMSQPVLRAAVFSAFQLPDDGSDAFELGRASTGATCLLETSAAGDWWISIPLLRAAFLGTDLFPAIEFAAAKLGAALSVDGTSLQDQWHRARDEEITIAAARSQSEDAPPLAHMPERELAAAHAWMIAAGTLAAERPNVVTDIIALAHLETGETRAAVILPVSDDPVLVPPLHLLVDVSSDGVKTLDFASYAHQLPRDPSGCFVVAPGALVDGWVPAGPELRTIALVEVLERETLLRLTASPA